MNLDGKKKILITTAIDYVNDVIHIGHAYQKILADAVARFNREYRGAENTFFVTGTDEHGQKVFNVAEDKGVSVREYVDEISALDKAEQDSLNISYDRFIRTTDEDHKREASELFQKVYDNGFIYKGIYTGLYCEGCEEYKTEKDLIEDRCPLHPTKDILTVEEENYFFKWSDFKVFLKDLFDSEQTFVLPRSRYKEMYAFIDRIEDIPVTRRREKLPWGISCPVDETHVLWVWFDALVNYYTFGKQVNTWDEDTEIVHFLGKDNARMHALLWPSMLKAAGVVLPSQIYVNGFLGLNGMKISKSLGNVIRPTELVEKYGVDPVRYYFLRYGPITEDSSFSEDHFKEVFNGDLANGLGNTFARLTKLAERSGIGFGEFVPDNSLFQDDWIEPMKEYRIDLLISKIWQRLGELDKHINTNEPWGIKEEDKLKEVLTYEISELRVISYLLTFIMPGVSSKLLNTLSKDKIVFGEPLFPRLN